jgi:hypothetical protein
MALLHVRAVVVAALALATNATAQPAGDVRRFDGAGEVTLVCSTWQGALGYTDVFLATVSDGHLHGQFGQTETSNSISFKAKDDVCSVGARNLLVALPISRDPQTPIAKHILSKYPPAKPGL